MAATERQPKDYAAMAEKFEQMASRARTQDLADGYRQIADSYRVLASHAAAR